MAEFGLQIEMKGCPSPYIPRPSFRNTPLKPRLRSFMSTRCGAVPLVTSEIADYLFAVVNVNTFEDLDSLQVSRQPVSFDGEEQTSRLEHRERNWIADVRIAEGAA
jgi:hypothetical protein